MSVPTDLAVLEALAARWSRASSTWDVAALTDLYTDDALLFGGRAGLAAGRAAIGAYFDSYRGVIRAATLALVEQHVLAIDEACFFAQGFAEFGFALGTGAQTHSRLRSSLLVVREGGGRIRAHHFSPIPEAPPLGA